MARGLSRPGQREPHGWCSYYGTVINSAIAISYSNSLTTTVTASSATPRPYQHIIIMDPVSDGAGQQRLWIT